MENTFPHYQQEGASGVSRRRCTLYIVIGLLILNAALAAVLLRGESGNAQEKIRSRDSRQYPEIQQLLAGGATADPFAFFKNLAREKGARYAFDVLKVAPIPSGTDMHLLGHTVGDELYRQEGTEGVKICTQDFRNACSHSIVVGLFQDKGEQALDEITEACRKAPGGKGAYTMCFHGLGHGILAATGYDLEKAVAICEKTGAREAHKNLVGQDEMPQCVSGAVMEMIGGGFHNKGLWKKQREKYINRAHPLLPCASNFIPQEARPLCYNYLTPWLLEASGTDLGKPTPRDFEKAFPLCDTVPAEERENRRACYGGFGKEFVVLVKERDIRAVDDMTDQQLSTIYQWCLYAAHEEGIAACTLSALSSLYWGGENKRETSVRFCKLITDARHRSACFGNLTGAVGFYIDDPSYRAAFCA